MSQGAGGVWPIRAVSISKDEARQKGVLLGREVTIIGPDYQLTNDNINKVLTAFNNCDVAGEQLMKETKNAQLRETFIQEIDAMNQVLDSTDLVVEGQPKPITKDSAKSRYDITLKEDVMVSGPAEKMTYDNLKTILKAHVALRDHIAAAKTWTRLSEDNKTLRASWTS